MDGIVAQVAATKAVNATKVNIADSSSSSLRT